MSEIKVLSNYSMVDVVVYQPKYAAISNISGVPFSGNMTITYFPKDNLLDFESFEQWVLEQACHQFTVESFARLVFDALFDVLGEVTLSVRVLGRTLAHGDVEVSVSRPLPDPKS